MEKGTIISAIILVIIVILGIWWMKAQWAECREAGLSVFYCLKHIS